MIITSSGTSLDWGAHTASKHTSPPPSSRISLAPNGPYFQYLDTTLSGQRQVYIKAGERAYNGTDVRRMVSHTEKLTNCAQACSSYYFNVGYNNLYWVAENSQWIHVGLTAEHMNSNSYNHWMQSHAAYGIYDTAVAFNQAHPEQGKIAVNDMSLPFGGLFDLKPCPTCLSAWEPSHWEHNRGTSVDVRWPYGQYAIPSGREAEFVALCQMNGASSSNTKVEYNPAHIHCQWPVDPPQ